MGDTTYPASPTGEWRRIYRDTPLLALRDMAWRSLGIGVVALIGWAFFIRDVGFLIFLVVVAAIGIAAFLAFRPSITLICTPHDFTLVHRNAREVFYLQSHPWQDLIASRYEEAVQRNYRRGRVTETVTRTFAIDLRDGYGVTFSESTDRFRDLIATVGEQTRHIPYVWVPSQGAVGRVVEQAGDYSLVPRQPNEVQRMVVP